MLFNSFQFFIFFPIVTGIYFLLPFRFRWFWLLAASCYFYMALIPVYILVLLLTILIDYSAAIFIENAKTKKTKRNFLILSIISTCSVLFVFKYYNFFIDNYNYIAEATGWGYSVNLLEIILPVGLSFHTFQSLSYVIEVYYGRQKAEKHFGIYSLYVMFYPQLVAGPIERPQNILHQFYIPHSFNYQRAVEGMRLILWGLFKKMVIADRVAVYVNEVYNHPDKYHGSVVVFASVLFAIQIYCDFSGYSDIAIGSARVMGFNLMENFNRPYFSKSIKEFWSRWHISLSTWFRDYLYIPMGGNRVAKPRWYFNLFFTFLVSGFWHGANWTFVIWGALHGTYLVAGIIADRLVFDKIKSLKEFFYNSFTGKVITASFTFLLVVIAWVFFRANNVEEALTLMGNALDWKGTGVNIRIPGFQSYKTELVMTGILLLFLFATHWYERSKKLEIRLNSWSPVFRWTAYFVITECIIWAGFYGTKSDFIYFQF